MELKTLLEEKRKKIDSEMSSYFEKKRKDIMKVNGDIAEENYLAMQNYVQGKGKRLRSIFALLGYYACGGKKEEKMILPSLSVEFFHNASLILDDVMDEDKERREIVSAHELLITWFKKKFVPTKYKGHLFANTESRFAVSMSVIATDMLFSLGAQTILDSEFDAERKIKALRAYEKTYRMVNLGQMLDVYYEHQKKITTKEYLKMAYLKTGALIGGALKIGGVMANASNKQLMALDEYANYSATTFQIQDDILDVTKGAEKGRMLGSDLRKGKTTILILEARSRLEKEDWKKIEKVLGKEKASRKEVGKAMHILHKKGIVNYAQKLAKEYNEKGKRALRRAKPSFSRESLQMLDSISDYLMERKK